ncbi:MAG: alpha/beta hydrolase [Acholeplasmataceae bacterium]|jgi:3-oxoadipate enol-lactonase|nr:alpha/beta hydrolase [Acholeplasmataceae bacterium]
MSYFVYNNKQVYYEQFGQGKSIIVLNGLMMTTASWNAFKSELSKQNRVIFVDFFDQGQTDKLVGENYNHDIQIELIRELMHHLELEKASITGLSYGANIALGFSVKYPDLVEKLVVYSAASWTSPWLKNSGESWNKAALTKDGELYMSVTFANIYSPNFMEKNMEWMNNRKNTVINYFNSPGVLERMVRLTNSSESYNVRNKLKNIKSPTLIITGKQDYITSVEEAKYLNDHIPNSDLILIEGTGHTVVYEKPHLFITTLLGFINQETLKYNV